MFKFRALSKIFVTIFLILTFISLLSFSWQIQKLELIPRLKRKSERGLYVTGNIARSPYHFDHIRSEAKKSGLNTIVIEGKGFLYDPLLALVKQKKLSPATRVYPDPWLSKLVNQLHREGFIVSLRLVVFKDDQLILARPDLAVRVKGGDLYRDNKGGRWADPYSPEVRLYNELIAERAALCGVDEVQFDYIRFPAEGAAYYAYYPFEKPGFSHVEAINLYLKDVKQRLEKYRVSIAVDIFGVTAWQRRDDIERLGQDLKKMAQFIDVLSPMFYPSHFHSGYDGFANPGDYPYYFVGTGIRKTKEILSGEAVAIVPWLQGFNLRTQSFGPDYIMNQIHACRDEEAQGFLIWNARNVYDAAFTALKNK